MRALAVALVVALLALTAAGADDDLAAWRDPAFQRQALAVARRALSDWVTKGSARAPAGPLLPPLLRQAGVFVSIDTGGSVVRGCRGTLEPRTSRLVDEIIANVREAALRDPLHRPLTAKELSRVRIVLCIPGRAEQTWADAAFDAREYGLVVESGSRAAVMLPWEAPDAEHMRLWAMKRAGIRPGDGMRMRRFPAVRFAETRSVLKSD
jgi:AMMECR1 domain-containing protein